MTRQRGITGSPLSRILVLLESLLRTDDGRSMYSRLDDGYQQCEQFFQIVERAYIRFVDGEIERFLRIPDNDPATRMVAKLIQKRLKPYLEDDDEFSDLDSTLDAGQRLETRVLQMLESALDAGIDQFNDAVNEPVPEWEVSRESAMEDDRPNLGRRRRKLEKLQHDVASSLQASLNQSTDFISNIKQVRDVIETMQSDNEAVEVRDVLLGGMDDIIKWQDELKRQLHQTNESLQSLRIDNIALHEEIIKVRQLTMTDEYTGLPNRTAFMRQLQAEMRRAQRHGHSLVLCMISIDRYEETLKMMGQDTGDLVLRCYAEDVVSRFREYDMVARIGQKEFAIVLPNTTVDGAIRALAEAQHRAGQNTFEHEGKEIILPTFSCGLALYRNDEKLGQFVLRAEEALKDAVRGGRKMLQVSQHDDVVADEGGGKRPPSIH